MRIDPAVDELSGFVSDRVSSAVDVEAEVLWLPLELVHIHHSHQHQQSLPLRAGVTVVECRDVEKRARCDQGNDLVEIDRRQMSLQQSGSDRLEVDVPMVSSPGFDSRIVPKERRSAIAGGRLDPLVVGGQEQCPVSTEGMAQCADAFRIDLVHALQHVDGDRVLVGELANGRPFGVFLVEPTGFVGTFGRDPVS